MKKYLTPIALAAFLAGEISAGPALAPLDFDPTFAGDGTLIIEARDQDYAYTGLIEPSGEIVVFGHSSTGNPSFDEAVLQRITADGTPGSRARFDAQGFGCSAPRAFLTGIRLSNGDYLGGGYVQEGCSGIPRYFNALQLTAGGTLVEEFDRVAFNNQLAYITALGEQSDGSIVASGFASGSGSNNETYDIAIARFTATGALDPTFGTGGISTIDLSSELDWSNDVIIDAADRVLIAGYATTAQGDRDMLVIRLDQDGSLDTTFNGSGVFLFDGAGFNDTATSIDIAPGGRILVGGLLAQSAIQRDATVLALTEDGALDTGFANNGIATVDLGNADTAVTDILSVAGRIYVTGWSRPAGGDRIDLDAAITVLRSNGSPNPFFNGGQPRVFEFDPALGPQSDIPQSIDVSDDGEQIVVTGYTDNTDRTRQRFGIARFIGLENALFVDGFEGGAP